MDQEPIKGPCSDPPKVVVDDNPPLHVVSRRKWKAQATRTPRKQRLVHPVTFVRLTETTTDADTYEDCSEYMREVQKFRMFHDETDIPYNFVIGPDNVIYVGVGWKVDVDRPRKLKYLIGNCIDIAFVGDMEDGFVPSPDQFCIAIDIIKYGVKNNYIAPTFKLIPMDRWRPSF